MNTDTPLVSVIIPAFNEEKYINKALHALLGQDYSNFEVIVVDNASNDLTEMFVRTFISYHGDRSLHIVLAKENRRGTNFARECARRLAKGTIIAQLDADCIPNPHWISNGVATLRKTRAVAVTGSYDYFDSSPLLRRFLLLGQQMLYPVVNMAVQYARKGAILIGGNAFIDAASLDDIGGYNTRYTFYGDDVDLGQRLSKIGHVVYSWKLKLPSSSRRYKAAGGFWKVNRKYQSCFWAMIRGKEKRSIQWSESHHPR